MDFNGRSWRRRVWLCQRKYHPSYSCCLSTWKSPAPLLASAAPRGQLTLKALYIQVERKWREMGGKRYTRSAGWANAVLNTFSWRCLNVDRIIADTAACLYRAPKWSMIQVLSAALASAKLCPSSLLLKKMKRWWWGRKMGVSEVSYTLTITSTRWFKIA